MAESNLLRNVRRRSITSSKFLQSVTMEDLEKQAMLIVKTRAEEVKQEEKDENKSMFNPHGYVYIRSSSQILPTLLRINEVS